MVCVEKVQVCRGRLGFGVTRRVCVVGQQLEFEQSDGTTIVIPHLGRIIAGECETLELKNQYLDETCPRAMIQCKRCEQHIRVDSPSHLPLWAEIPLIRKK